MQRPIVRTVTLPDGRWTVGAEVPRPPRPWRRWIANAATVAIVLCSVAACTWVVVDTVADICKESTTCHPK